jgi:hypothetical protein
MDHEFITIKQAAKRYVVSDVTLRRLAREITRDEHHEFREYVRPGPAEIVKLRQENKPFEYEMSTKLLGLRYKQVNAEAEEGSARIDDTRADVGSAAMSLLESTNDLLRDQLKVKDEQIRQLNESLRAMNHQQNATNMLLVRLSERIPLLAEPAPLQPQQARPVKATTSPAAKASKVKRAPQSSAKKPPSKEANKRNRGVLDRLFRRSPAKAGSVK